MTIFFYKRLTRNPEIENNPVWVLPNIWRLGRVMDTKFGTNVSNRMLLNSAKFQSCSFYFFWVIKGKPTGGQNSPPPPTQIRVNQNTLSNSNSSNFHENQLPHLQISNLNGSNFVNSQVKVNWKPFWDQFNASIHSNNLISKIGKFIWKSFWTKVLQVIFLA